MGCENPITGNGPQPNFFDERDHEPLLNIFGILRPGIEYGLPLSFVHLEGSFSVTAEYPESFNILDASVVLYRYDNNIIKESIDCIYTNFNVPDFDPEYRPEGFYPVTKQTYGISCKKEGYPELTAQTTVPAQPQIAGNSIQLTKNVLKFTIIQDSSTALYDIYLQIGEKQFQTRIPEPENINLDVELEYQKGDEKEGLLTIYAYDLNLSNYLTTTITVKPNTYQEPPGTVKNGYGSFGSLNILNKTIIF